MSIRNPKTKQYISAPCGKCPDCRTRRAQAWIFRLQQEEKIHRSSIFLTLTYSDDNLPLSGPDDHHTLYKPDVQNFLKRLRKNTGTKTIKYYFCGEYGTHTWRPHYHAILFDATYEQIDKAWGLGHIHTAPANPDTMAYTTKYMCKTKRVPAFEGDTRLPEFSLMSKGMGKNYLTPEIIKYYETTQNSFLTLPGGFKQPLPRYYRDRIFTEAERETINSKTQSQVYTILEKNMAEAGGEALYHQNRYWAIKKAMKEFETQSLTNRNKL